MPTKLKNAFLFNIGIKNVSGTIKTTQNRFIMDEFVTLRIEACKTDTN